MTHVDTSSEANFETPSKFCDKKILYHKLYYAKCKTNKNVSQSVLYIP